VDIILRQDEIPADLLEFFEPVRHLKHTTWKIPFEPSGDEHYAAFPTKLIEPMILAGSNEGDTVLDIFSGTGTTGVVALRNNRNYTGIELNESYIEISRRRLADVQVNLF
jgi:site-specific DNA-methyltransferase (adenine-specific)